MLVHLVFFLVSVLLTFNPTESQIRGSNDQSTNGISSSSAIPSIRDAVELGHLSAMVYGFRHFENCTSFPILYEEYILNHPEMFIHSNSTFTCHMYERDKQDTQVLILSKDAQDGHQGYIAVVYAGTDDFRNMMTDTDILTKVFGPTGENGTHPLAPSDDILVHAGFNNAVFRNGLFDRIKDMVNGIKGDFPDYRLMTTGHSLGAADSVLTAVALKLQDTWSDELVLSLNFGCPKTGNRAWGDFVNSMDGLGIWRVVNGIDLVPRLPPRFKLHHVGHTLQLNGDGAHAFWLHDGDKELGYRGVPFGWNALPYALAPVAAVEHLIGKYIKYLDTKSAQDRTYYVDSFERINGDEGDDRAPPTVSDDDDIWSNIPDDDIRFEVEQHEMEFINLVADKYLKFVNNQEEFEESNGLLPSALAGKIK